MKVQDLKFSEIKEAWEKVQNVKSDFWYQDNDMEKAIPRIFLELAENKTDLITSEGYLVDTYCQVAVLKDKYPNTVKGIKALTELAEQGYGSAMQVLWDYFRDKGKGSINQWTYKMGLQWEADIIIATKINKERIKGKNKMKEYKFKINTITLTIESKHPIKLEKNRIICLERKKDE